LGTKRNRKSITLLQFERKKASRGGQVLQRLQSGSHFFIVKEIWLLFHAKIGKKERFSALMLYTEYSFRSEHQP